MASELNNVTVVGRDCSILSIVAALQGTESFTMLLDKYVELAECLEVPLETVCIKECVEHLRNGRIGLDYALHILFQEWTRGGENAEAKNLEALLAGLTAVGYLEWVDVLNNQFSRVISPAPFYAPDFDIRKRDKRNDTELHRVAYCGDEHGIRELLSRDPEMVNLQNNLGETPLLKAARGIMEGCMRTRTSCFNILLYLIDHDADVNSKDVSGSNFFIHLVHDKLPFKATPSQFHRLVDLLLKKGKKEILVTPLLGTTPLHLAVQSVELQDSTLTLLHAAGVDFNLADTAERSLLAYAVKGLRSVRLLEALIDRGADHRRLDKNQHSILHSAACYGHTLALNFFLMRGGLDMNASSCMGNTPLHYAVMPAGEAKDVCQILRLLIMNGADKTKRRLDDLTPYDIANKRANIPDKRRVLHILHIHGRMDYQYFDE